MLRVRKEDLRLGMFIESLEGSWFDHPFWRSKFLLEKNEDLQALQSSDIETVWVDESRSLAPAIAHVCTVQPAPRRSLIAELAAENPAPPEPRTLKYWLLASKERLSPARPGRNFARSW